MNNFNIRDIESLTGIKAHTLRVWEKRYGNIMPPTSPGKHRQYDNNDLKHILRISSLYHNGIKISHIANMSTEEIATSTVNLDGKTNFEVFITRLIEFSIDMNEAAFKKLFSELKEMMGIENIYLHVIFPFLSRIGNLWLNGSVEPVQEHFCSNLIRNELLMSIDQAPRLDKSVNTKPKVILFTPEHEFHELPLLFFNLMFRKLKIQTYYLGSNIDQSIVQDVKRKSGATILFTYLITNFSDFASQQIIDQYSNSFNDMRIIFAGPGFRDTTCENPQVYISKNIETLIDYIKTI
jgi:MerR family transcriptional regulator, light-induced transcriptional regulator